MAGRSKKDTDEKIVKEEVKQVTQQVIEPIPQVKPQRPKIDGSTPVEVMNNTTGIVVFKNSRTQAKWILNGYGSFDEMLVSDLTNMRSTSPGLLNNGHLIIMDEDVVKYLRLDKIYDNILEPEDIDNFFDLNDVDMKETITKMPRGMQELLFEKAKERIENNDPSMDYNSKRRVFEELFDKKFDELR